MNFLGNLPDETSFVIITLLITLKILPSNALEEADGLMIDSNSGEIDLRPGMGCEGISPNEKCGPVGQSGPSCLNKRRILGLTEGQDEFVVVEAFLGQDIQLDCHYCNEKGEDAPKNWYYNDRLFLSLEREIPRHLELPLAERKFVIDEFHKLTIRDFRESEGAIYFCQGLDDTSSKFNFLVDVISPRGGPEPIAGTDKEFKKYFKENVRPINKALSKQHLTEIKNWLKIKDEENFDVNYEWSPWGSCNVCGRDAGTKRRHGKCRLTIPIPKNELNETMPRKGPLRNMKFGVQFSCQSLLLLRFLDEKLVKRIKKLSDFVETSKCKGKCLVDTGISQEWQETGGEKKVEIVTLWKLTQQSVTLACPGSELESQAVWIKDGSIMSSWKLKGHITLTIRNELEIHDLRLEDSGNYSCFLNSNYTAFIYDLRVDQRIKESPDVSWMWTAMGIYSLTCFVIWLFLIIIMTRVAKRIQSGYKPLSDIEQREAVAFRNL